LLAIVEEVIQNQLPTIDNKLRMMTLQLELERLDAMSDAFYRQAM
jgi:hypothetical protein